MATRGREARQGVGICKPEGDGLVVIFYQPGLLALEIDQAIGGGVLRLEVCGYFGGVRFGGILVLEDSICPVHYRRIFSQSIIVLLTVGVRA